MPTTKVKIVPSRAASLGTVMRSRITMTLAYLRSEEYDLADQAVEQLYVDLKMFEREIKANQ